MYANSCASMEYSHTTVLAPLPAFRVFTCHATPRHATLVLARGRACFIVENSMQERSTYVYLVLVISDQQVVEDPCFVQIAKLNLKTKNTFMSSQASRGFTSRSQKLWVAGDWGRS